MENVEFEKIERFELSKDFDDDFRRMTEKIKEISDGRVDAIAIGTPGTYNEEGTLLISGGNSPEWVGKPFIEMMHKEFNCSVFADNDAVVASLGEALYGQGKDKDFIYITWGTGVGGTHVKLENEEVNSRKIPWQVYLQEVDVKCGGNGISKRFGKLGSDLEEHEWKGVMDDLEFHLEDISNKFKERNIIIGGGISSKQKHRLETIGRNLSLKEISLEISSFGDDVGLYGAMAFIKLKI